MMVLETGQFVRIRSVLLNKLNDAIYQQYIHREEFLEVLEVTKALVPEFYFWTYIWPSKLR